LPFYGNLDEEEIDYVCESLREIIRQAIRKLENEGIRKSGDA